MQADCLMNMREWYLPGKQERRMIGSESVW